LWFELMRWPFRTMWCFVYPSNASDRWVLIACGAGLATSVETPEDSLHQECDQCKLQIWTWHTHIFCHQLRAFIRIRVVRSCDALMECNCQDL
jgi:hypothetical protein